MWSVGIGGKEFYESPVAHARPQLTSPEYQEWNSVVNSKVSLGSPALQRYQMPAADSRPNVPGNSVSTSLKMEFRAEDRRSCRRRSPRRTRLIVRDGDYALMWILSWRFRKAYAVPGGWGGTDRLGALYEWRVIRPGRGPTLPTRGLLPRLDQSQFPDSA
jgi:hypothetical protein